MKSFSIIVALFALELVGCRLTSIAGTNSLKDGLEKLTFKEVHLDAQIPKKINIGLLRYEGGLEINSSLPNFGGLSGFVLTPKGDGLIAVTDHGDVVKARFVRNTLGQLIGLDNVNFHRLRGVNGNLLSRKNNKQDQDAEAIERLKDGSFLVSFERHHRILRYKGLRNRPSLFSIPPGIEKAPRNGGIESIASLPDGRILVLTEKQRTQDKNRGDYVGWLLDGDGKSLGNIFWKGSGVFRPTDFAALPNGDVLLLQRRYSLVSGLAMRMSLISAQLIKPGARMLGIELAQITPPLSVDNFEGIAVFPDGEKGTMIYILSDDNFNPFQRTLLQQFRLPG